jgi:hypothetical protein
MQLAPAARSILAERRVLSYYGNPWARQMGVLGELSKPELVAQLRQRAAAYEALDGRPVQPAIHLIASVAQAATGADGLYLLHMPNEVIEEYAALAEENGMLLILDLQVGRSTVVDEIAAFERYLQRPYVHLALDPEFTMPPDKRPGQSIGSMDARQINYAVQTLAAIAEANDLPNKILIIHQFRADMITNKVFVNPDPRVDLVCDMDGFGGQGVKMEHYLAYAADGLMPFTGIKLFFRHDVGLMSPAQVLALTPPPDVVIYQ